jgi:integrase
MSDLKDVRRLTLLLTLLAGARRPAPDPVFDRRGAYRSPVTLPSYRRGRPSPNKGLKFPVEVLTPEEVNALINACGRGRAGWRNRAMIATMYFAGLRVSEMLALLPKDVDLDRGEITVLHGKGDKRRTVAFPPGACAIVEKWLRVRNGLQVPRTRPLYCVITTPTVGLPVNSPYVRNLLRELAAKAGVEKRVHPHGLRHSYASYLADQRVPITTIQTMLGHSSIAITQAYLHKLNPAAELELIRGLEWPGLPAANGRSDPTPPS